MVAVCHRLYDSIIDAKREAPNQFKAKSPFFNQSSLYLYKDCKGRSSKTKNLNQLENLMNNACTNQYNSVEKGFTTVCDGC